MKSIILLFAAVLIVYQTGSCQNQVFLNIHQKLGDEAFVLNSPAVNNMGHDFQVTRMEYYISGITIIHDNGLTTKIDDLWILVNATAPIEADLGNYPITEVEAIHFAIGIDSSHNHLDPASYAPSHPLGPKNPSMHWGWAAGYRFMAFEGNGGPNYDQLIQLHGLGDQNYIKTKLLLQATPNNNRIDINLDADYTRVLENIGVDAGIIVHGETLEAQQALENFRYFVFSPSNQSTATSSLEPNIRFTVFPNPVIDGQTTVWIENPGNEEIQLLITDVAGKLITQYAGISSNMPVKLNINQPGAYFIQAYADEKHLGTRQLISK